MNWRWEFVYLEIPGQLDANGLVLEALVIRADDLSVGESCTVVLPPERIVLLKE